MRLFIVISADHNRCCNVKYSNRYRRALFRSPLSDFNHKLIGYRSNTYPSPLIVNLTLILFRNNCLIRESDVYYPSSKIL